MGMKRRAATDRQPDMLGVRSTRDLGPRWREIARWLKANQRRYTKRPALVAACATHFRIGDHYAKNVACRVVPTGIRSSGRSYQTIPPGEAGLRMMFSPAAKLDARIRQQLALIGQGKGWIMDWYLLGRCPTSPARWKAARARWKAWQFVIPTSRGRKLAWAHTPQKAQRYAKLVESL